MNNASETTCKFDLWLPHLCAPIHTCRHAHTDVHTHIREKRREGKLSIQIPQIVTMPRMMMNICIIVSPELNGPLSKFIHQNPKTESPRCPLCFTSL